MRLLDIATVQPSSRDAALHFWVYLKWAAGAVGAFAFGRGEHNLLALYLTFIFWDFVTGVLASWLTGKTSSNIAFRGIGKKLMGLAAVGFGHAIDLFLLGAGAGQSPGTAQALVTRLMIGYEFLSITENLAAAGIMLPRSLTDLMARLTSPPVIPGTKVVVDTTREVEHVTATTQTLTPVPPRGEKGEKGDKGARGPQGPAGV